MDAARARDVWTELRQAIDEVFRKNASNLSFEHLYRCCVLPFGIV